MADGFVEIKTAEDRLVCRIDPARLLLEYRKGERVTLIDLRPVFEAAGVRLVTLDNVMRHERYGAPLA